MSATIYGRKDTDCKLILPDLTAILLLFAVFLSVSYLESIQITNNTKIIVNIFDL
jgi:hypothetical protein